MDHNSEPGTGWVMALEEPSYKGNAVWVIK
jgi:hypothetical protein